MDDAPTLAPAGDGLGHWFGYTATSSSQVLFVVAAGGIESGGCPRGTETAVAGHRTGSREPTGRQENHANEAKESALRRPRPSPGRTQTSPAPGQPHARWSTPAASPPQQNLEAAPEHGSDTPTGTRRHSQYEHFRVPAQCREAPRGRCRRNVRRREVPRRCRIECGRRTVQPRSAEDGPQPRQLAGSADK